MSNLLLGGPISLSRHQNLGNDIYILGDQHIQESATSAKECVKVANQSTNTIIGIETWIEEQFVTARKSNQIFHIILEIDPILSQTLTIDNTWISAANQHVQKKWESGQDYRIHHCDVRGAELLKLFKNRPEQINDFLSTLYDAVDATRHSKNQIKLKDYCDQLQKMDPLHRKWSDELIYERSHFYTQLVDQHVHSLINRITKLGERCCIVIFVGEAHATVYRKWLSQPPFVSQSVSSLALINGGRSKCLNISSFL